MKTFWDVRYNTDDFVYGRKPNDFFASQIEELLPGKLLLPGEGEGRNAVYAASRGWLVDAFDQSGVACEKALKLAEEFDVQINYQVSSLETFNFESQCYDVVGLSYFHAIPDLRQVLHTRVMESLKPGGIVLLEGFHTSQLGKNSGGPQSLDLLFDREKILGDFKGLKTLQYEEILITLDEGQFHQGDASILRYRGVKN